jgi:hypothetical protein
MSGLNLNKTGYNFRLFTEICSRRLDYSGADVFNIVVIKRFVQILRLAAGTTVFSDDLQILIIVDSKCALTFQNPPSLLDLKITDWGYFLACLEVRHPGILQYDFSTRCQ